MKVVVNAYGLQVTDAVVDLVEETVEGEELGEGEEDLADDVVWTDDDDVLVLELEATELEVILELVVVVLEVFEDVVTDAPRTLEQKRTTRREKFQRNNILKECTCCG